MLEGNILMSRRERKRLAVLAQVKRGELTLVTAGGGMVLTSRQAKRGGGGDRLLGAGGGGSERGSRDPAAVVDRPGDAAGAAAGAAAAGLAGTQSLFWDDGATGRIDRKST